MARTFTWIGTSGVAAASTIAADWSPSGGPPATGDTAIIGGNGTVLAGDGGLKSNTAILSGGQLIFTGDSLVTYASPSLDAASLITTATSPNSMSASSVNALGNFVNLGTILAAGAAGSTLSINVGTTVSNGVTAAGYSFNPGIIQANAGNTLTINIGAASELFNTGSIIANGGTVIIAGGPSVIAGGIAPVRGEEIIEGGGTIVTTASYPPATTGTTQVYYFADSTAGNTLKIENLGSFDGRISGFSANDTIDLGSSLAVGTLVYSTASNVLNLENNGGTILASLLLATGAFAAGTFAVSNGTADGFTLGTIISNGTTDTALTTALVTPVASGASGTWQTAVDWVNATPPGPLDTALIGQGTTAAFTLTTGTSPVSVSGFTITDPRATVHITSNLTATPNGIADKSGTLEVTAGSTVTASSISITEQPASVTIDAGATVDLSGHLNVSFPDTAGTISVNPGDNYADTFSAGTAVINGAMLAGPAPSGGGGGSTTIGYDSETSASVTVNTGGTVTDTRTLLGSGPTSAGSLTLNGAGASWTDTIDHTDTAHSTGYIDVGYEDISANTPAGFAMPVSQAAAQLLIENGATMTEQESGFIGCSPDSSGTVTVTSGGFWNLANNGVGFLDVGHVSNGTLSVLNGGSVAVGNVGTFFNNGTTFTGGGIGVGNSLGSSGTLTVSGAGSQVTDQNGIGVGKSGQGVLNILNGGSVAINSGGLTVGGTAAAGSSGTVTVGGSGAAAVLSFGGTANGMTVGGASRGTVVVTSGGTISMNGTRGIGIGQTAGAVGVLTVTSGGVITQGPTGTGMGIGQAAGASGTLQVLNNGTVTISAGSIGVGVTAAGSNGTVTVSGAGALIKTTGTVAMFVGSSGNGLLTVTNGGSVADNSALVIGASAGGVGTMVVSGATVTAATLAIDNAASQAATGYLTIGASGAVNLAGGASVNKNGYLTLGGGVLSLPASSVLTVGAGGQLAGFGQVLDAGGLNNVGSVIAAGGKLELSTGAGAMAIANAATLAIDFGFSGVANFTGGNAVLSLGAPASASGTIDGFSAGDTISLAGIVNVSTVTLGAGNVLTVNESNGSHINLQLDPTQSFTGASFAATVADSATNITVSGEAAAGPVIAGYTGILRVAPSTSLVNQTVGQIVAGQTTLSQFESGLIASDQALYTTLPALVTIDAYYTATPQASTLNAVAASTGSPSQIGGFYSGTYLNSLGYSDPNVWTIMASQWGADQTSAFYQQYNSFGTNYSGFIAAVYQREFGFAPSAANLQTLVNDVPGVQALLGGGGGGPTPIQVVSGIYGYLLYVGQTTPSLTTQYATAANAFLQAAANGTAIYGQELTQQFPSGSTSSTASVTSSAMADPNVITVTGSDQLIDPGAGGCTIQFLAGTSADTLMLHTGGVDQVSGFDPGTDALDVAALLSESRVSLTGDVTALSDYLTVADQGSDALVRFDPTGQGGGGTVAVLQGLGGSVTGLDTLIARGAIRVA